MNGAKSKGTKKSVLVEGSQACRRASDTVTTSAHTGISQEWAMRCVHDHWKHL